jgi:hypothetical protein
MARQADYCEGRASFLPSREKLPENRTVAGFRRKLRDFSAARATLNFKATVQARLNNSATASGQGAPESIGF